MVFPTDHVVGESFDGGARTGLATDSDGVPPGWLALDMGPASRTALAAEIERANTVRIEGPPKS